MKERKDKLDVKQDVHPTTVQENWDALAQLETIFRAFPDLLFRMDASGKILDYKAGKTSSLYVPPDEFLGKRMQDILPTETGKRFAQAIEQALQTGEVVSLRYQLRVPDGERWFDARLVTLAGSQIVAIVRDITEPVRTEERFRHQLQHLAALRSIDAAITSSFDLNLTLSVLLKQVTSQLGVDAADVLLHNPHTRILEYAAGLGFRTTDIQHTTIMVGKGYAGLAALERRSISILDLKSQQKDLFPSFKFTLEGFVSYFAMPLIAKGQVKGVLEIFHRSPLKPDDEWTDFLATLVGQAAIAIDSATLFQDLQRSNIELTLAYDATIEGWSHALDLRDRETEGHTRRVAETTVSLARSMGVSEDEMIHIRRGALLHDIGKVGVPDSILLKPGPLTDEEWKIMRQHPQHAYQMLSPINYLASALDIPRFHHEKWDGSGYPRGLQGEQIPLAARIFTVLDVYDALTSRRPYRPAWSPGEAREYIRSQAGNHFDPRVVSAFLQMPLMLELARHPSVVP